MSSTTDSDSEEPTTSKAKKVKYYQSYRAEWERLPEFKGWLTVSRKGANFGLCKVCNKDIVVKSGKDSLLKHIKSKSHKEKIKIVVTQSPITSFTTAASSERRNLDEGIKKGGYSFIKF